MANITETETWDDGVYQLETTDPVEGGADGVDNAPHKNLANRTLWLKAQLLLKAALNGSATQKFKVAAATADDEAMNRLQITNLLSNYAVINSKHALNVNVALTISDKTITLRKGDLSTDTIDLTSLLSSYVLINSKHSLNANVALTISNNIITLRKGDGTTDTIDLTSAFQNNAFGLGIGQTVQNLTASRSADVTYTNTTGKPIFITITGAGGGGTINRSGILTVDGVTVSTMGTTSSTQNFSCSFVIPNGSTYKYTHSNMPIQFWHELR